MKRLLLILLLSLVQYGCTYCGPQQEPAVDLQLGGQVSRLRSVHAVGTLDPNHLKSLIGTDLQKVSYLTLPLSLHADSTTYIFEFEDRKDTMTIYYKREFYHKDKCGFVVDLAKPDSGLYHKSTFSLVTVSYYPYIYTKKIRLFDYISGIGIYAEL
jgi:hypothetical protein